MTTTGPAKSQLADEKGGERRKSIIVLPWAILGAACVVMAAVGWIRWLFSDDFEAAEKGPDDISDWHLFWVHFIDISSVVIGLAIYWFLLVRPWIRTGSLSPNGMIVIALTLAYFLDAAVNKFEYNLAFNAYSFNHGTWAAFVPFHGDDAPSGYGNPWAWALPQYLYMGAVDAIMGLWIIKWLRRRYAGISNLSAFSILFLVFAVADFVFENIFLRLEIYNYPRTWEALTLWSGSQYQFPLYECVLVGIFALGWTWFRLDWEERGHPFVAAGIDRLNLGARAQTAVTLLAVIGFGFAFYFLSWVAPWNWLSVGADSIADLPTYMAAGR